MAIPVFGVTDTEVRAYYFPQLAAFSSSTNPTDVTVDGMIAAEAAKLAGKLSAVSVSATDLDDDSGATYPIAYAWCQDVVRLGAAVRVAWSQAGFGENATSLAAELERRYKELEDSGSVVLGDAPTPSQLPNGPQWHVGNHSLDTGDATDISDAIPRFRRSDEL